MDLFRTSLLLAIACLATSIAAADTRLGPESRVITPKSAEYSSAVNFRPGDGEIVNNNPPIFTWFYNTNHLVGGDQNPNGFFPHWATQTNSFRFQVATQPDMSGPLAVDVVTPFNFYNFIGPLNTNATRRFWWRVQYITNNVAYCTSATRAFIISATASNWNRSMFADPSYHTANAVHPMFCYRAGEEAAIWEYAKTNDVVDFNNLITYANAATNKAWWKNPTEWPVNASPAPKRTAPNPPDAMDRPTYIGAVLFMHRFSGDDRWTNASMSGWLITNLSHYVNWFVSPSNNYPMLDYGDSESPEGLRLCVATDDWLYDYLGNNPATFNGRLRTNALHAMRLTARFMTAMDFWFPNKYPLGQFVYFYDWNYRNRTNYCVQGPSGPKNDSAHSALDRVVSIPVLVGAEDDPEIRFWRDYLLNYYIARTHGFTGWAAHHSGAYGYVDGQMTLISRQVYSAYMLMQIAHPEMQVRRTDFCSRFPEWYSRMQPYGKRMYHGAFGDGMPAGTATAYWGVKNRGWDLASLTGNGYARQHYDLHAEQHTITDGSSSRWDLIPTRYHFPLPPPATNTTSMLYPEDGFVVASSKSPSEFDCYTNGVGFSFKAPPRGNYGNHQVSDALSFDLWAYGAQITDGGGASLDDYGYHSEASPGLFVNGIGVAGTIAGGRAPIGYTQTEPIDSCIVNYAKSGTDFVYCAGDATALFTNSLHPLKSIVTKVKRHILFPRSKYWVIYDEFAAAVPSTFAFRWHIPWAFRYDVSDNALARETVFTNHRIGSNSLQMVSGGFTYVAGNYADAGYPNPPRIPVHVQFANSSGSYGIFRAEGTKDLGLSKTGVIGTSSTNSTLNPFQNRTYATVNPDRAVGMWVTNKIPSQQWSLMTVIVPQQPGVPAPVFQRIDDSTIVVTYDGVTETNTFGTNYTGAATYMVDPGVKAKLDVRVQGVRVRD